MAILLQPDSLSFASNLKKFVISSAEEIRFKLLLGETLLIDESYSPDASGKIEIDVKEVVISQLGFSIPTTDTFEQTSIMKLFTAQIDEAIITFTALRAGVENLSDVPSDFLTDNWLTWQPQTKQTSYNQPEWLTYYSTVPVTIKVKFYLSDNTTQIITLANQAAGKCVTYNMQFARIMSLQAGSKYGYFDVWAENGAGARLNYIQRYIYQDIGILDEFFLAENSLGGIDTVVMSGDSVALPEVENIEALFDEESVQLDGSHTRIFSKNTGWKSKLEAQWLWDFFSSKNRYKLQDGAIKKISIRESDIQNSFQDDLKSFTFKYRLSADKGLLNIPRSADPLPENLEITTPEGLFFLAPRLVEFPSAKFVDEFLLPVQSPYLQEWKKITLGVVKGTILDYIRSQISPGIPQSLLDLSDIDPSLEMANVGAYMVKLASGKWGPGSVSIDLSNYLNKGESDERYSFKSHSHDYVPTATFYSHTGDSVKHTTQEDKDKIIAAYNDKHTHNNKANLDTINQDLSKSSSVEFADLVSAGSVAFYGGTGGGSTPASSLLNLSDIDSSLATAAVGSPLVKLANGKWGPGSVSIDLTNYFTKEESDARFAFKAHSHDYVAPTAFNAHTGDTTKHITSAERVAWNAKESALGNPDVDGKILASTAGGVRSWVNRYVLPIAAAAMLGGVMIGANVNVDAQGRISVAAPYSHPATHPASMIDESATRRFLTDTERANWNDSYDKRHTHGNKANLDSINQNLSQTSNVKFNDVIADGSVGFYGGVGSGSTPVASLLDLSDIDASISAAATGTPLVKLANGKWGAGSVSIDLSNYYNKSDADARYAFKSHSHDYVAPSAFNAHTGSTSNPHSVTASQVGAISRVPYSVTDFTALYQAGIYAGLSVANAPHGSDIVSIRLPYAGAHSGYRYGVDIAGWSQLYHRIANGQGVGTWYKIWSEANFQPSDYSLTGHTHDNRYYTETESDIRYANKTGSISQPFNTSTLTAYDEVTINSPSSARALIIRGRSDNYANVIFTNYDGTPNSLFESGASKFAIYTWTTYYNERFSIDRLSGASIFSSTEWNPLTLNTTASSNYLTLKVSGATKGYFGWFSSDGVFLQNAASPSGMLGVLNDTTPYYSPNGGTTKHTLIHSGNIGSQSVNYAASAGNADTLDNIDSGYFVQGTSGLRATSAVGLNADDMWRAGFYVAYNTTNFIHNSDGGFLTIPTWGSSSASSKYAIQIGSSINGSIIYRHLVNSVAGSWRTVWDNVNLTSGLSSGRMPYWNGSSLVNSLLSQSGSAVSVNASIYASSYIETASYLKGTSVKLGTWEIKENASGELEFIQSGVLKFKGTSAGLISQGEVGFYS